MEEQKVETTVYSLKDEAPTEEHSAERREGERHMTLFRVGSILIEGQRELCLIKNISAGGMMIRAYCEIEDDAELTVELKSGQPVSGRVTWVKDKNVGVAFATKVDVLDILSNSLKGPRPRMPRIEIDCPVTLYVDGEPNDARCLDISQGGIKVEVGTDLEPESDVVVNLPALAPEAGVVKWHKDGVAGITFNRLMPLSGLVGWLQEQRGDLKRAS